MNGRHGPEITALYHGQNAEVDPYDFMTRVDAAIQQVHNTPRAPGVVRTWMPGEQEYVMREHNRALGIPLSEETLNDLMKTAKAVGVNLSPCGSDLDG